MMDEVLGLNFDIKIPTRITDKTSDAQRIGLSAGFSIEGENEVPREILDLVEERILAKKAKDFKRSDAIRDELKSKSWVIEDTPKGQKLKKI